MGHTARDCTLVQLSFEPKRLYCHLRKTRHTLQKKLILNQDQIANLANTREIILDIIVFYILIVNFFLSPCHLVG